jgi:hypothetical protein
MKIARKGATQDPSRASRSIATKSFTIILSYRYKRLHLSLLCLAPEKSCINPCPRNGNRERKMHVRERQAGKCDSSRRTASS